MKLLSNYGPNSIQHRVTRQRVDRPDTNGSRAIDMAAGFAHESLRADSKDIALGFQTFEVVFAELRHFWRDHISAIS